MVVRAKVKCSGVRTYEGTWKGKPAPIRWFEFYFVYGDKAPENKEFWEATPSGKIEIAIQNPEAAKEFELGKEYYVDFTKAE